MDYILTTAFNYPTSYRYTREHQWISLEGDIGAIGLTRYMQGILCDIMFLTLPKIGDTVIANAAFGSVESIKTEIDLYSPVSGTVVEINEEIAIAPEILNKEPHDHWILKVKLSNPAEVDALLDDAAYINYISFDEEKEG